MAGRYDHKGSEHTQHDGEYDEYHSDDEEFVPSTAHLSLAELRALAQTHLDQIADEDTIEVQTQRQTRAELQKYAKPKRKGRAKPQTPSTINSAALLSSIPSSTTAPSTQSKATDIDDAEINNQQSKGPKLRSASDVLDRLRWDPSINLVEYHVGYLERFEGIKEMPVRSWIRESTEEDFIPQHRIKYVKRKWSDREEIVWHREAKVDKVFGSGVAVNATDAVSVENWDGVSSSVDVQTNDGGVDIS